MDDPLVTTATQLMLYSSEVSPTRNQTQAIRPGISVVHPYLPTHQRRSVISQQWRTKQGYTTSVSLPLRIDLWRSSVIAKPRFDLSTYCQSAPTPFFNTNNQAGRLAYFYSTTSPLTLFASSSQLQQAQKDVTKYEGLIRDNGKKGVWVNGEEKSLYDKAKQCELLK